MDPLGFGLVNVSRSISDPQMEAMAAALQTQLQRDVPSIWNIPNTLQVQVFDALRGAPSNWWKVLFTDTATAPDAYGYHTDMSGSVYSEIEISVIIGGGGKVLDASTGASVSTVASHEILETVVDPLTNLWLPYPKSSKLSFIADEVCDPVQGSSYPILTQLTPLQTAEVWVSDFVTPYWFDLNAPPKSKFDFLSMVDAPFKLGPGGYAVLQDETGKSSDIWGSHKPPEWRLQISNRRKMRHRKCAAMLKVRERHSSK